MVTWLNVCPINIIIIITHIVQIDLSFSGLIFVFDQRHDFVSK